MPAFHLLEHISQWKSPRSSSLVLLSVILNAVAFHPMHIPPTFHHRIAIKSTSRIIRSSPSSSSFLMSSVGGGQFNGGNNGNNNGDNGDSPLDDFLGDPMNGGNDDSRETRKNRADSRLPINYRSDNGSRDEEFNLKNENENDTPPAKETDSKEKAVALATTTAGGLSSISQDQLDSNPYMEVVSRLTPSEMILRFTNNANPRVQDAVKNTILGLIGSLPRNSFSTQTFTTAERLASLMFQLQMTGYMFKNAEYRMALSGGERADKLSDPRFLLGGDINTGESSSLDLDDIYDGEYAKEKSIKGKVRVNFSGEDNPDEGIEVDAASYLAELHSEVKRLKDELSESIQKKDEDLLGYIRTLPPQEMQELTSTITEDVLTAMKGLVNGVMTGIASVKDTPAGTNDDDEDRSSGVPTDTVLEQSGEAMAQLCMWQLVAGYNMRELEVRQEMKDALMQIGDAKEDNE